MKKYVQTFEEVVNKERKLSFDEAFEKFIKNHQVVRSLNHVSIGWTSAHGVELDNGYIYASHGGGCSGEDCNTTYIISPGNEIIAEDDW
jgi:hypothetical protein